MRLPRIIRITIRTSPIQTRPTLLAASFMQPAWPLQDHYLPAGLSLPETKFLTRLRLTGG